MLNDGRVGLVTGRIQGKEVPVFNEIELLEPSKFGTFVARVTMPAADDVGRQLAEIAARLEGCAEDWSTSVRMVCKACSEGRPHKAHDTEAAPVEGAHILGIAAESYDHAMSMVAGWKAEFLTEFSSMGWRLPWSRMVS